MAMPSGKNFSLSPAASDLGLGDMASQQMQDDEEERKKKLLQMQQQRSNQSALGGASLALFGSGGMTGAA